MIDWQMSSAGADWQSAHEEIRAAFEDSGLVVYPRGQFPGLPPEEFMGVPTRQISSRVTGGGGGDPNAALYVMARKGEGVARDWPSVTWERWMAAPREQFELR